MSIVFASNDAADFPGATVVTTAGDFRSAYVSEAFEVSNGTTGLLASSWTLFPEVSGDVTWIHYQFKKDVNTDGVNADGNTMFAAYDSSGNVIFEVDVTDGAHRINIAGIGGGTFGDRISQNLKAIDFKVDTAGSTCVVEMYVNGALIKSQSQTSSAGNPIALYWRSFDQNNSGNNTRETVSEFIVADEDTRNMGLAIMTPNAVGNYTAWTGNHVETGDSDLGTGAVADSTGLKLSSDLTAYAGPATAGFRALVVNNKASTRGNVGDLRNFLRISSTDYNGAAMSVGETIKDYITVFNTNPNTTDTWASADIAGVEVGTESLV